MNTPLLSRRSLLGAGLALPVVGLIPAKEHGTKSLRAIEREYDVRLGVYARNLATGQSMTHRQDERFAMCSTFKTLVTAVVLRDHDQAGEVLDRVITYTEADLLPNSPITSQHVADGMTVRALCDATLRFSDNCAANLLLDVIGGPPAVTAFVRTLGDCKTRLDRYETDLNTGYPGDLRDTTTPEALGQTYRKLIVGNALSRADRGILRAWMLDNQTSGTRFRAALPEGWTLADKTGGGGYASNNDAGVAFTTDGDPIVIVVLTVKDSPTATPDNNAIVDAARLVFDRLGPR